MTHSVPQSEEGQRRALELRTAKAIRLLSTEYKLMLLRKAGIFVGDPPRLAPRYRSPETKNA